MSKDVRKALMIAKGQVSSGYLPPGDPQRTANLSKFMEGAHPEVLNKDGSPKTLYHGSIEPNLKRLDPRKAVEVEGGSFLTNNPDVAHQYTYERAYGDIIGDEPLGEVHHVHVNMRNPYIHPTKPGQKIVDAIEMGRAVDHAKKHGHDGVIVKNIDDSIGQTGDMGDTYVAFHPTQIKSATGNNGQYDPNEPEINKAEGGVASLPMLPERPPLDVLRRMDPGARDAWRRDRDARMGRNYHPLGSPERDANLMDFMEGAHPLFFKEPGVPRPVYHATNKDIRRFIPGGTAREEDMESGPATWLTFDPTSNPAAHHIGGYKGEYKEGTNVMPLYANIKNPLILNNKDALKAARNKFSIKSNAFPMLLTKDTKNALQEAGHDGIVYQKEAGALDGDEVLAFDSHQLKSALGNRGVYDKQDPTVDYQRGGYISKAEGGEVEETVPEAPHTLESQLQAFLQGKRKAVLYTHEEPALPEGAGRVETQHGVFHYNPALIDERSIKAAVAGDRINEILGYGRYSKKDILNRVSAGDAPVAVVGRDAEGREVVAAAGTHGTANEQASAIAAQLPTGGQVHIESPQQVISERIAAMRSPEQGNKDARKALMIARAMGGRIGKADGGGIDEVAPVPAPVTSGPKTVFSNGGKQYEFAVTPPDKQITSKDLAAQTTDALQQHLSLPYMQQVANSKAAANKLAPYVGREKNGAVKPFLTMNAKLEKASAGYEAGPRYDAQAPLQLEGGVGVETIGMPLAPAYEHNKFKVCPNSAICKDECLGVTSGNYAQADWWPRQNSKNRTQAFLSEPGALAVQLHGEIQNAKQAAAMRGNRLAVRLNVLSDIDPRVHETLIKANPDVDFYDYTKMNYDPIAPNHHYTYSSTGLSQPAGVNGLTEGVENKHQNWKQMRQRLDTGSNVAMVFSHKEHLPREVYDRETDKTYRVVDGTTHDYRPLDKQAEGSNGVIIGLQNLNKTGKQDNAYKDSNGFVVHYDPQVQMVPNAKTGLPTKTPVKGPSPGVNKAGKSLPRPTFPTNYRVEIAPQGGEGRADGGAVNHGRQKIHPDYAAQQFHNFHMFNGPESAPLAKGERPTQYAYGGPVEGDRQLDQSGFYNAAAEAAQGIPQAKGTPQQMMSMVQKAPGTQETMKWSGADQAFAGQPIVSKDDLVKHFQTNAPKLEEKTFTGDSVKWGANKNLNLVIPGGENYREVLLKTPVANLDKLNLLRQHRDDLSRKSVDAMADWKQTSEENVPGHPATLEAYQRVNDARSALKPVEEELKSLVKNVNENNYNSSHWTGHPNIVAHLRMSDRTLPQTNEKALHLEEVQSDWGQDGKRGFKKTDEELRGLRDEMLALHKNYLDLHGSGAPPDQLQAAESKYNSAMNKFNNGFKAKTPEGPYVGNTNKWTDLALKRALIEAARGGHDKLIWTPGEEQALRYKENDEENDAKRLKGMNKYYGEIVPSRLEKILQSIGHKAEFGTDYIKGKTYDADLDVYKHAVTGKYHVATGDKRDDPDAEDMEAGPFNTHGEAVAHRDLLYKGLKAVPSLKITPAMRETISKGLPRKTGGFVPPARSHAVEQALKLTSKSGATLPAAVFLARQHQRRD